MIFTSNNKLIGYLAAVAAAILALGCGGTQPPPEEPKPAPEPATKIQDSYSGIDRIDFNKTAVRLDLPLYWYADKNENGAIEADEIVSLLFHSTCGDWTKDGAFTTAFHEAFGAIMAAKDGPNLEGLDGAEARRRALVARELDQGIPTVVYNDLSGLSDEEKTVMGHLLAAAKLTDELFAVQNGSAAIADRIPADDPASRRLFGRNWGPTCLAPLTESEAECSAIPGAPKAHPAVYPADIQEDDGFCEKLSEEGNGEAIMKPFVVVQKDGEGYKAVAYTETFAGLMSQIADELDAAAAAIRDPGEAALKTYLTAAAKAYRDNQWEPADEAWSKMDATNSKWYVRVAPDETYWEPCNRKAGFHLTLARINSGSLQWQEKLTRVQQEMEDTLAKLIGKPYKARKVSFHMPDFIDIVTNSGNDRSPMGATIGQSLPNWGPVANEGRGRTVAMTNLYTDPDSEAIKLAKAQSLLTESSMEHFPTLDDADLLGVILHEATHNLGPSHEYEYKGKTDDQAFGGPLATVMEELKAQTGALYYIEFLRSRGLIDDELAKQSYVAAFNWACGHISRGMYTSSGRPKPYSQVSAIHVGFLMDEGAVTFDEGATAANGTDKGAYTLDLDRFAPAFDKLMKKVGKIKAKTDKKGAQKLIDAYVKDEARIRQDVIAERTLRHPKASFVYALDY